MADEVDLFHLYYTSAIRPSGQVNLAVTRLSVRERALQ